MSTFPLPPPLHPPPSTHSLCSPSSVPFSSSLPPPPSFSSRRKDIVDTIFFFACIVLIISSFSVFCFNSCWAKRGKRNKSCSSTASQLSIKVLGEGKGRKRREERRKEKKDKKERKEEKLVRRMIIVSKVFSHLFASSDEHPSIFPIKVEHKVIYKHIKTEKEACSFSKTMSISFLGGSEG